MAMHTLSTTDTPTQQAAARKAFGIDEPTPEAKADGVDDTTDGNVDGKPESTEGEKPKDEGQKPDAKEAKDGNDGKKKNPLQKRIDQALERQRLADQRADLATRRADDLAAQLAEARKTPPPVEKPAPEAKKPEPKAEPKLDDYDSVPEWQTAHSAWTIDQASDAGRRGAAETLSAERERVDRAHALEQRETLRLARLGRIEAFIADSHPDYDTYVDATPLTAGMMAVLDKSAGDLDVQVAWHLSQNLETAKRIAALEHDPVRQIAEMGEVIAAVKSAIKKATPARTSTAKPVTKAPDPSAPAGSGRAAPTDSLEAAAERNDGKAYRELRRQQRG